MGAFENKEQRPASQNQMVIHPQLEVGSKDDPAEKEADMMSEKVMKMSDDHEGPVRRMGEDDEEKKVMKMGEDDEEKKVMKMGEDDEEKKVMKMGEGSGSGMTAPQNVEAGIQQTKGSGQQLPGNVQKEMGSKMGADFSDVKIHTGPEAHEMNESISAKAFTHGQDIYFKNGNYNPESGSGKKLLAHELTHTMQQGGEKVRRQNGDVKGKVAQAGASAGKVAGTKQTNTKTQLVTKWFDVLELPENDRIVSVQIVRDIDKVVVENKKFLGPLFTTQYVATAPFMSDPGNYTFIVESAKSGIKRVTLYNNGYFFTARLEIKVKIVTPEEELKKFDVKKDPLNDASLLPDAKIKTTKAYKEFYNKSTAKLPVDKEKEAILATRLMLTDIQKSGNATKNENYLFEAKNQLGVSEKMQSMLTPATMGSKGSFTWNAEDFVGATDFSKWVNYVVPIGGKEPDLPALNQSVTNNCYGSIFYAAFLAKAIDRKGIADIYKKAYHGFNNISGVDATDIETTLRGSNPLFIYTHPRSNTSKMPLPGDMVVFGTANNHICMATGKIATDLSPEVISLWNRPNVSYLQKTSIKALLGVGAQNFAQSDTNIYFFSPIWK